jgi:hypothetical protein
MELSKQQEKEYSIVNYFVEKQAKTWFMENFQKWNSSITSNCQDVNEMSYSANMSKTLLVNRLFNSDFHRNWIVNSWSFLA